MIHQQLFPPKQPLLPHIEVTSDFLFERHRSFHAIPIRENCSNSAAGTTG